MINLKKHSIAVSVLLTLVSTNTQSLYSQPITYTTQSGNLQQTFTEGINDAPNLLDQSLFHLKVNAEKLNKPNAENVYLGYSVSLYKNTAAIGAPGINGVFVTTKITDTFSNGQSLFASDPKPGDFFGIDVATDENTIIVGAPGNKDTPGAAYIFVRDQSGKYNQQAKLVANDGLPDDGLGTNVTIKGNIAIVAAPFADINGNQDQGAVYVFNRTGTVWTQQTKIFRSSGAANDFFGSAIAFDDTNLLIGSAGYDDPNVLSKGAVFAYVRNGNNFNLTQKILADDGQAGDIFGAALDISGNTIIVGAPLANTIISNTTFLTDTGTIYFFDKSADNWAQTGKINFPLQTAARFGSSVAILGDRAIAGMPYFDTQEAVDRGAIVNLSRNASGQWRVNNFSYPSSTAANAGDRYGFDVDLGKNELSTYQIIGEPFSDSSGKDFGNAYIRDISNKVYLPLNAQSLEIQCSPDCR